METDDDRALLLMLGELRELNRLQSEHKKSIEQMTERIEYFQTMFESIENKGYLNGILIREIRSNLLRLSILSNPETANMYRRKIDTKSGLYAHYDGSLAKNIIIDSMESVVQEDYYTLTTGVQVIETNSCLFLELTNPLGSGKAACISTISGGSEASTVIDLIRNGSLSAPGIVMTPRNLNTACRDNSVLAAKLISQNSDMTIGGQLLRSLIQTGDPVIINFHGRFVITENNSFTVCLRNINNTSNRLTINISWWEI